MSDSTNNMTKQHALSAKALIDAMIQLNYCWPHWWELLDAEISVGKRRIQGPLPDPWRKAGVDLRVLIANQGSLAWLNPQPLPPAPREVAVGLEIADRLIGVASLAITLSGWMVQHKDHDAETLAMRLAAEVDDLCPPLVPIKIKRGNPPNPPGPDPWPIKLSALAQLAMGARFGAAARAADTIELAKAYTDASNKLTSAGLANLKVRNNGVRVPSRPAGGGQA